MVFGLPDPVIDWVLNTMWDGHIAVDDDGTKYIDINSDSYKCPTCNTIKIKRGAHYNTYMKCSGSPAAPHETVSTTPIDWHNILTQKGIYFLIGQLKGAINSNIATGNFGRSEMDIKRNVQMQDSMLRSAFFVSFGSIASIISNYKHYVAKEIIDDHTMAVVFSESFNALFMVQMTYNIMGNYTKAKDMGTLNALVEHRIKTESESHTTLDYPMGTPRGDQKSRSVLSSLFGNKD